MGEYRSDKTTHEKRTKGKNGNERRGRQRHRRSYVGTRRTGRRRRRGGGGNVRIIESWRTARATSMGSNGRTKCGGGIGDGKIGFFRLILLDTVPAYFNT